MIGYALIYKEDKNKLLWLDYLAIAKKYQGLGFGTLFFNKLLELETTGINGVFMEVEIPDESDLNFKKQKARSKFYGRLGAKNLKMEYLLPTNDGGTPLYLFLNQ